MVCECTVHAWSDHCSNLSQHPRYFTVSVSPSVARCLSCSAWQPSSRETRQEVGKLPFQQRISQSHASSLLKINTSPLQATAFLAILFAVNRTLSGHCVTCSLLQCLCFWVHQLLHHQVYVNNGTEV